MIDRLRFVMIVVDRLEADGVRFGVGPTSTMNKAIREWLIERAKRSPDHRPSRRREITPTAVRALLKQVKAGRPINRASKSPRRRPTREVAKELFGVSS